MNSFMYNFGEIPMLIHGSLVTGYAEGAAEIEYSDQDNWWIVSLHIDAHERESTVNGAIILDSTDPAFSPLCDEIEITKGVRISEAIYERMTEDGEIIPSDKSEHSTLNRAGQGV